MKLKQVFTTKVPLRFHRVLIAGASFLGMMVQAPNGIASEKIQSTTNQTQINQNQSAQTADKQSPDSNNVSMSEREVYSTNENQANFQTNSVRAHARRHRPMAMKYGGPRRPVMRLDDDKISNQNNQNNIQENGNNNSEKDRNHKYEENK